MGWYCYVKKNLQKVISLDIVTLHDIYLIQKIKTSHCDEKTGLKTVGMKFEICFLGHLRMTELLFRIEEKKNRQAKEENCGKSVWPL